MTHEGLPAEQIRDAQRCGQILRYLISDSRIHRRVPRCDDASRAVRVVGAAKHIHGAADIPFVQLAWQLVVRPQLKKMFGRRH